ncbi:MAG: hypothetical protein MPJ50_01095 [Pirellulales bacterium]|nr:hypothetical protein [Pirellulales bacterium]
MLRPKQRYGRKSVEGVRLQNSRAEVQSTEQQPLSRQAEHGQCIRSYSVRPSNRRWYQRRRRRQSTKQPVWERQFSLARMMCMVTLFSATLSGLFLVRNDPLARFMGASAMVTLLAVVPKAWWNTGGAVLAIIGTVIFCLLGGAVLTWFVSAR